MRASKYWERTSFLAQRLSVARATKNVGVLGKKGIDNSTTLASGGAENEISFLEHGGFCLIDFFFAF